LSLPENDPVFVQVAAGGHPGLLLLKRGTNPDTGKKMTVLGVDEIRKLASFFGMTSGAGGWRVAIVDTADDMNDAAANALLKALEEPPSRAMLILLSNAPGKLLPTIRSRCRRLDLQPLPAAAVESALQKLLPELDGKDRAALAKLSGGSIGAAITLANDDGLALANDAEKLTDRMHRPISAQRWRSRTNSRASATAQIGLAHFWCKPSRIASARAHFPAHRISTVGSLCSNS
jgi:DNA polymerase-3 subunit delta'